MPLFICCGDSIEFGDGYAPNYFIDDNRIKFFQDYHQQVLVTRITDQPGPVSQPEVIWKYHAGGMIYSTPALIDNLLFFGSTNGSIYCLDLRNGSLVWRKRPASFSLRSTAIRFSPLFFESNVIFGSFSGFMNSLDLLTGKEDWIFEAGSALEKGGILVEDELIVGNHNGVLFNISAATGITNWEYQSGGLIELIPAIKNDLVLFGARRR